MECIISAEVRKSIRKAALKRFQATIQLGGAAPRHQCTVSIYPGKLQAETPH
jgi:hypothetical protein